MSGAPPVVFYFDFLSGNAYLAWTQIHALADRFGRAVEPVAVLLAGLLRAHGQLGPAEIPAKGRWMVRDLLRKTARLGVPYAPPASHPFPPLAPLRMTTFDLGAGERRALCDALFRAAWAESRDMGDPAELRSAADAAGLDGPRLLAWASGDPAKRRLAAQTEDAIARGVFGVPTMRAGDELFFGFDDLAHLELHLAGRDPLDPRAVAAWQDIPRAAVRRRHRLPVVGVMGSGQHASAERAEPLGRWLAQRQVHLLTGGHGGAMEAVSRAFLETRPRAGAVIGILRAGIPENPWIEIAIRTHLSQDGEQGAEPLSRNHLNVLSSDVIVALPGGPGTRSELELALRYGRPAVAFLRDASELPGIPGAIPIEPTLAGVQRFVLSHLR